MSQRTARQWIINIILIVITLSFLGVSIAPLIGGIFFSQSSNPAPTSTPNQEEQRRARLDESRKGYEAVLKKEPKNQTALTELVGILTELGDIKGTLEPLQTLADSYPDQPQYRFTLAGVHLRLGDRAKSKAELRTLLSTRPGYLEALERLIQLELEDKRPEAAIGTIKQVLDSAETANKIQPNSVDVATVQWLLGEVYRLSQRYDEALTAFEEGIKTDDKNFRSYVGKAQVKRAQGNEAEAKAMFNKALEVAPSTVKDRINEIANPPAVQVEPVPDSNPVPSTTTPSTTTPSTTIPSTPPATP